MKFSYLLLLEGCSLRLCSRLSTTKETVKTHPTCHCRGSGRKAKIKYGFIQGEVQTFAQGYLSPKKWRQKVFPHCLPPPPSLSSARHIFSLAKCHVSKASRHVNGHRQKKEEGGGGQCPSDLIMSRKGICTPGTMSVEQCQMESWR